MGRKSSAKSPRTPAPPPTADLASSSSTPLLIAGVVALVALAGWFTYSRSSQVAPATSPAPVAQAVAPVPAAALLGPHPQTNLPPLPFTGEMARSPEVVRAAYQFAAEHPEVLSYVPCYCGCEHAGHRGNEDCFVAARNDKGDVTDWEPHGAT